MPEALALALLFPAGLLAGVVNVLAGGGSFLTLPLLIASGLPVNVANGTNRLAVLLQAAVATHAYQRRGQIEGVLLRRMLPALMVGAVLGGALAVRLDPSRLRTVFGVLFLVMGAVLAAKKALKRATEEPRERPRSLQWAAYFTIGLYGGFIQAGVGLWLILGATTLSGVDALRANGAKLTLVLLFTLPAFALFVLHDQVRWVPGLILAAGTVAGSALGVRITLARGPGLIEKAVLVVLVLTGVQLLL